MNFIINNTFEYCILQFHNYLTPKIYIAVSRRLQKPEFM